jgi:hypothetical protein
MLNINQSHWEGIMKKVFLICFIITTFSMGITSAQEPPPPPPTTPFSSIFPDAVYVMTQEQIFDGFALRLWEDSSADEFMFNDIAVIQWNKDFGGASIQIEMVSEIDSLTGTDINADGYTDIILKTYSGGAHCCSSAHVYSLQPQNPIKLYQGRESNCPINFADVDTDGIYEIVTCDDSFAYVYCPYASSYAQPVILKYDPSWITYFPATAELIGLMSDFHFRVDESTAQNAVDGAFGEWDGTTKCQMLPAVLGYLYTDQPDLAWQTLDTYYTAPDIADFRAQIEGTLAISPLYRAILPPSTMQPPVFIERQMFIDDYVVRIWKNQPEPFTPPQTIGQIVRISDDMIIAEIDDVVDLGMDTASDINNNGIPDVIAEINDVVDLGMDTASDINNNGIPDVIMDTVSGMNCCTSTFVYDLGATPQLILQTRASHYGGRFEDVDGDGTQEFLTVDDAFVETYCSFGFTPAPQVILGYDNALGMYVPVNKLYSHLYADAIAESTAIATSTADGQFGEFDGTNKCSVLPVVLNYLYSGEYDMAWTEFYRLYRGGDTETFRAEIEATVNGSSYYVP